MAGRWVFSWEPGANRETAELLTGLALLTLALAGRPLTQGVMMLLLRKGTDDPKPTRDGSVQRLRRPDGSELQVESYGPPDAPPIVLTHGWGANATEWYYEKKHLAGRFRLVVWDEPGLGLSRKPDNNDYSLEKLARDLDAVLALCGDRPAVLLGHSIGGMITLTFCRLFPEALGTRVAGLVLVHTTPTNPVRTTKGAAIYTALEKPVLVPLLRLTIALWPLVWVMNWLSYLNGSAHRSTHRESFAGTETRGQLDFAARFMPHGRPDVLARGMFGMLALRRDGDARHDQRPDPGRHRRPRHHDQARGGRGDRPRGPEGRADRAVARQAHGPHRAQRSVRRAGGRVRRLVSAARRDRRAGRLKGPHLEEWVDDSADEAWLAQGLVPILRPP